MRAGSLLACVASAFVAATTPPGTSAAAYMSLKKRYAGSVSGGGGVPSTHTPGQSQPASRTRPTTPPHGGGKPMSPLSPQRDNSHCNPHATCTECTARAGCAWCKNLNECVSELGTRQTCSVAGRRAQGLFQPGTYDHVASTVGDHAHFDEGVGTGSCGVIINTANGLYHVHPDQAIVMSCDYLRERGDAYSNVHLGSSSAAAAAAAVPCCGDGACGDVETRLNCPTDCGDEPLPAAMQASFTLDNRHLQDGVRGQGAGGGGGGHASRLFGNRVAVVVEHPMYHCHRSYGGDLKKNIIKWFLDRPSHDLHAEMESGEDVRLAPGSQILELGCGDGRDSMYLASLGHYVTGVDVGAPAIEIAKEKASERGLLDHAEFLAFDALQLPEPLVPVDFIYDNTVYCNLRIEYLEKVLAMLERLTTPGRTLYMLNCGNANDRGLVQGHPRLRREAIEADLSGLFDIVKAYEGVYDMDLSGSTAKHASKWNKQNRGVLSWTMILRRKAAVSETPGA